MEQVVIYIYIYIYIYIIAKIITLHVYLKHDFCNINCQFKYKLYIAVWVSPPPFQ
jgi:hypothetical protein